MEHGYVKLLKTLSRPSVENVSALYGQELDQTNFCYVGTVDYSNLMDKTKSMN